MIRLEDNKNLEAEERARLEEEINSNKSEVEEIVSWGAEVNSGAEQSRGGEADPDGEVGAPAGGPPAWPAEPGPSSSWRITLDPTLPSVSTHMRLFSEHWAKGDLQKKHFTLGIIFV